MDRADLDHRFAYHAPPHQGIATAHETVRATLRQAADDLAAILPPECRETSLAVTHLEEAMMWANAAIARRPAEVGEPFNEDPEKLREHEEAAADAAAEEADTNGGT